MARKTVYEGKIEYLQVLDENGVADKQLEPTLEEALLRKMYESMVRTRTFDRKVVSLQRQGRCYTYVQSEGQEGCQVGSALALGKEDWIVPAFRENAVFMARGVPMAQQLLYWMGSEEGSRFAPDQYILPISIPVGSQTLHALGLSWAAKLKKEKRAAIAYFGDGATSEGEFHEALNFAGVFSTPTVFFCQNNQWAISVPRSRQTHAETIAQKAIAYGIEGLQVDGNDVLGCYLATKAALEKAYAGKGPTLIEAVTYRMSAHTTSDDPTKYRNPEEVEYWKKRDPIARFQTYLKGKGVWNDEYEKQVLDSATSEVEEAVKAAEAFRPNPEDMFKYLYAEMTPNLKEQMEEMKKLLEG